MQVELPFEIPWELVEDYLASLVPDVQAVVSALEEERSGGAWAQFDRALQENATIKRLGRAL